MDGVQGLKNAILVWARGLCWWGFGVGLDGWGEGQKADIFVDPITCFSQRLPSLLR